MVKIYVSFWETYPALIRVLEEIQFELKDSTAAEDKTKVAKAASIINEIYNLTFCLTLSGLCDVYKVFSTGVNILQVIN